MDSPWDYFGAWNYAESSYSHTTPVVATETPYPRSRWAKVLDIVEHQWIVHSRVAAVEHFSALAAAAVEDSLSLPGDQGDEVDSTDSLPTLVSSSGEVYPVEPDTESDSEPVDIDAEFIERVRAVFESLRARRNVDPDLPEYRRWHLQSRLNLFRLYLRSQTSSLREPRDTVPLPAVPHSRHVSTSHTARRRWAVLDRLGLGPNSTAWQQCSFAVAGPQKAKRKY